MASKNEIIIKVEIFEQNKKSKPKKEFLKPNLNKKIFFLCDKENNESNENFEGLNSMNSCLYIDDKKEQFTKSYIFDTSGEHIIKYKINEGFKLSDLESMFSYCIYITSVDFSNFNSDNVHNMKNIFNECRNLKSINFCNFKTDQVTSLYNAFHSCCSLKELNLESFNTSNVETMNWIFCYCKNLERINIKNFDLQKALDNEGVKGMFYYTLSLKNIKCNKNLYDQLMKGKELDDMIDNADGHSEPVKIQFDF